MKIKTFFKMIGVNIDITVRSDGYCQARGQHCETIEGCILTAQWGSGSTPNKALADYARLISGKRLVVNAFSGPDREEHDVPNLVPIPRVPKKKKKISRKK